MTLWIVLLLAALGSVTGFLAGLLGIGGGMILTPFLAMLLPHAGVPESLALHCAIATSMSTILFTSLSSVRAHAKRGAVVWSAAAALAPGILLGGIAGAQVSSALPVFWVALFFSLFVGSCAVNMFRTPKAQPSRQLPGAAGMFSAGAVIGAVSALVGAGGGFLSVPFMTRGGIEMHKAVGTSASLGFPIALAGTIGYIAGGWRAPELPGLPMMLGFVHLPALAAVAAASVLTAPLGPRLAHSLNTKPLRRIFAVLLLAIALNMLRKAIEAA